ncbi:hypothetical protein [Agrobacterium rosae]|uniref:hypothetical protein n=1 Tax=Agrobacterium rosae TaxID=1972867 RepID=UPI000CD857E4|nr:hypothetical protein [Agrobacterium rosae]POO56259.1 hypothetical protein CTT39_05860 [Agrobacterium rosae]
MSVKKETTTNSENSQEISRSAFDHAGSGLEVPASVKGVISTLNTKAADIVDKELKARHVTYEYVAKLCDAAIKMGDENDEFTLGVQKIIDHLIGKPEKESWGGEGFRQPNPFLNLCRIADGAWGMKVLSVKAGTTRLTWMPNRSGEKFAGVCRFAVRNGFSGDEMLEHFLSGAPFILPMPTGEKKEIKATINAVIAEDRLQNESEQRDILSAKDWKEIFDLKPIVTLPFTKRLNSALTLSEGGIGLCAVRVVGDQLYLLGDAGFEPGNPVLRQFKKHKGFLWEKRKVAMQLEDEVMTLPEEYLVDFDEYFLENAA